MSEQERYEAKTRQLKEFVHSDEAHGTEVSPRFRAKKAGRALNLAEAELSRLDPLLTDIRFRYADTLDRAGKGAKRLRDHLGYVIREAGAVRGPDDELVSRLRAIQHKERHIGGARALRRIERAQTRADQLREAGGLEYVFAAQDLANSRRAAGQHVRFLETIDDLIKERPRLRLDRDQRIVFAESIGPVLLEAGEVARAIPPLTEAYNNAKEASDAVEAWEVGMLGTMLAQCLLAGRERKAAETVLRESLSRLARFGGERESELLVKLRHRTVAELGTALFLQNRFDEAIEHFQEATNLLSASRNPREHAFTAYRTNRIYATIAREQAAP